MFAPANSIEETLRAALPAAAFRPLTEAYLVEPRGRFRGSGGLLIAPSSTKEVAEIVKACAAAKVAILPYGGGTGLVGGQTMAADIPEPLILSMERMTKVRSVDPSSGVMVVEAGAILQDVQGAAEDVGRLFPLSLASQGSARIGGNLATNAGGVNVLRYGNARDLCLGLEAVLPDGTIHNGLSGLRKDNTGYDLRHLLIGAEGTLGIITAAALKMVPRPKSEASAFFVVKDPQGALDLLALARETLGDTVSAFELISKSGLDFLKEVGPDVRMPFAQTPEWMVLVDVGTSAVQNAEESLAQLFELGFEADLVSDAVLSQSEGQRAEFWTLRESLPEANRRIGAVSSHDISVPLKAIPEFIAKAPENVAKIGQFRINCFGHVGDGNLHWNVFPMPGRSRSDHDNERSEIKRAVHELVHALGGSVSAEHGVGRLKVDDIQRYGDPAKLAAMRAIKDALDPQGIMNPGAVLSL